MLDAPTTRRPPGRRMAISGAVVMGLAVVVAIAGVSILAGRFDVNEMQREVAFLGPGTSVIPGQVAFRIVEPLASDKKNMTVGVGASTTSTTVTCTISEEDGTPVSTRRGSTNDSFINPDISSGYSVAVVADDLPPGSYVAKCERSGEPSSAPSDQFTVGRVFTAGEIFSLLGPVFGIFGLVAGCGIALVVGLILLIVGLVKANRARRGGGLPPVSGVPYGGPAGGFPQAPQPPSYPPGNPYPPWSAPPPGPPSGPQSYPPQSYPPSNYPPPSYPPPTTPPSYPPVAPRPEDQPGVPRPWVAPRDDPPE